MENVKRPVINETDEDLLKQQEIFLKESKDPSVKVIPCGKKQLKRPHLENNDEATVEKSTKNAAENDLDVVTGDVLLDVKERDISSEPFVFQPPPVNPVQEISQLLNENVKLSKFASRKKGQSIFVQLLKSEKEDKNENYKKEDLQTCPLLIDGSGLASEEKSIEIKRIHEENLSKLSSMSKEEILHHQQQLQNYLKPEIVNFIKKKGTKIQQKSNTQSLKIVSKPVDNHENELPGEILKKEGNQDCDALILEKAKDLESNSNELSSSNQSSSREAIKENMDFELPEETEKIIEGSSKGLWRNMNKIEKEKLEWMTSLPQPKPVDLKTGYTARFDFEGKLLAREADIPTYKGLHHHGEEPEVPGYSLEELFLLARSSLQSQRITALNTIAHILENNWFGMMDECFEAPLLPLLINAGIVPLLRWALDDTSITSISATISAIHSLLISKPDEVCSNKIFCWLNGHFVAQLEPQDLDEPNFNIEELTDADLIKLDVIKGFLRIDILPRFMYILKAMCPPPLVCKLVLEICARLAQHSIESAKQVAEHQGLLDLVFEKFLPLNWKFVDLSSLTDTVGFSCPMNSALKLVRIIISSCKDLAIEVVQKYELLPIISFYLTVQPCDGKLTPQEVQMLVIETLKTWNSVLCYGYGFNIFLDLFPIFLKQLEFCLSLNLNCDMQKHLHDFEYAAHLLKCFESVSVLAAEQKDSGLELASAMNVIFKEAVLCLHKWLWQLSQDTTSSHGMTLVAACMNFIVTHCKKSHEGLICENWKPCAQAKDTFEKYLIPTMKSNIFGNFLRDFRCFSLYLNSDISGNKRDGQTIVSLGSVLYNEDIIPILKEGSPLPLLTAILNYTMFYKNSFHDSGNECVEILFSSPIMDYLKAVSLKKLHNNSWFLKYETYFIFQLLQLSPLKVFSNFSLFHETAISILPVFTSSEECIVEDLFENTIFNQTVISNLASTKGCDLDEKDTLQSLIIRLPVIAQCYTSSFLCENDINKSRKEESGLTPEENLQVISNLQWILMCHMLNFPVLKEVPASVEFYYLCQVFLLDEDFFRDEKVKSLLIQCLTIILKQKMLKLAKIKWDNINAFDDIFLEMLIQYEAVSYGDETFGNFLAIPLQQCYPSQWKKLLFTEYSSVLSFLRIPLKNLLVSLQNFLEPYETDIGILSEYFKALASGILNHRRCPLFYLMAVHHIHNFIFTKSESYIKNQKILLSNILRSRKELQKKLLLYLEVDTNSEFGFSLSSELSLERKNYLKDVFDISINI